MDLTVLSKKISSYRTPKGRVTNLPNDLLGEILHAWEQWTGSPSGFYKALSVDQRKMAKLMGKAKQLKREGCFDGLDFTEVVIEESGMTDCSPISATTGCGIELVWKENIIRFGDHKLLINFLNEVDKKAA